MSRHRHKPDKPKESRWWEAFTTGLEDAAVMAFRHIPLVVGILAAAALHWVRASVLGDADPVWRRGVGIAEVVLVISLVVPEAIAVGSGLLVRFYVARHRVKHAAATGVDLARTTSSEHEPQ